MRQSISINIHVHIYIYLYTCELIYTYWYHIVKDLYVYKKVTKTYPTQHNHKNESV